MKRATDPDRAVTMLLRAYPPRWRDRYGAEFAELLRADLLERPRCPRRTLDVISAGFRARAAAARSSIIAAATIGFLAAAASLWAQLIRGSLHHADGGVSAGRGVAVLTVSAACFLMLGVLAIAPLATVTLRQLRRSRILLAGPVGLCISGASVLAVGMHHFAASSPTTHDSGVLARVGDYAWAAALPISTFWAHPHRLARLPADQLTWMCVAPVAVAAIAVGGVTVIRRLQLPARVVRFERRLAIVAAIAMAPALAAAATWVVSSQYAADARVRAGTLDLALVAVMAAATVVVGRATDRACQHG